MWIFESARLRLTIWVVVVVALVSLAFSTFIYKTVTYELENSFMEAELKIRTQPLQIPLAPILTFLNEDFERARKEVLMRLMIINGVIIFTAGAAGYFLAGKALAPIETALSDQKRFVSDASHELRTPLTSLKTEIEVALRDKKLSMKDAKLLIKSNLEEVEKMQHLTNYLLACTRYGESAAALPMTEIKIADVVEGAVKKIKPLSNKKKVRVKELVSNFNLRGNLASLEELLVILLDNAVKYSDKGSLVKVRAIKDRRLATLEVEDSGPGIKSSEIPYVFNRFYRADASRSKQKVEGYGLGLSIAKGIVDAHRGTIKVQSKVGQGTTFIIALPA